MMKSGLKERLIVMAAALHARGLPNLASTASEAAEVIASLPFASNINAALYPKDPIEPLLMGGLEELRALRVWHWKKAEEYRDKAIHAQKKSVSRMFKKDGRDEYQTLADRYNAEANQHLRFVQTLNAFFPRGDNVC